MTKNKNNITLSNHITIYLNEEGKSESVFQDFPIFDEENPNEIIGYETVGFNPNEPMKLRKDVII